VVFGWRVRVGLFWFCLPPSFWDEGSLETPSLAFQVTTWLASMNLTPQLQLASISTPRPFKLVCGMAGSYSVILVLP